LVPLAVEDAPHEQAPGVVIHEIHEIHDPAISEFNLYGSGHGIQVPTVSAVVLHGIQETTEHVVALHEPDVAVVGNSDDVAVVVDFAVVVDSDDYPNNDDNSGSEHDSDGVAVVVDSYDDLNSESFIIDFQRLSINDSADNIDNNVERVNHNDLHLSNWQEILCRLSSNILLREHKVISKEKAISLHEARSRMLECIICMENICSIIIFPCKHFIMCKPCFDTLTENPDVRHSCPLCRTIIQSNSHVFLA
jgi:hypothetical protein